jgi:hypothetical protein
VGRSGWEASVGCEEGRGALDFGNVEAEGGVPRSSSARRRGWSRRRWSSEGRGQRLGLGGSCGGKEGCWGFSLGEKGPNWWFPEWPASGGARDGRRPCWARARDWALPFIGPEGGGGRARGELSGEGSPGGAQSRARQRPAMAVAVASRGCGGARVELR